MNFLELCEYAYERVNRYPVSFSSVELGKSNGEWVVPDPEQRRIIRAVQDAYDFILGLSEHWSFFLKRGKLLQLVAGTASYDASAYSSVTWDSIHLKEGISHLPLSELPYRDYLAYEQASEITEGVPVFLSISPDNRWVFWPTPLRAFELWGEAQLVRDELISSGDEPLWDEQRHKLVGDLAAKMWEMQLDSTEELVQKLNVEANGIAVTNRIKALLRDYTVGFG
jgi:hypothetical protein